LEGWVVITGGATPDPEFDDAHPVNNHTASTAAAAAVLRRILIEQMKDMRGAAER